MPLELCPEADVPAPVVAVFEPEPWAEVEPEVVGSVSVVDPVPLDAVPVEGVEPVAPPPAVVLEVLPVVAVALEPLDPVEPADVVEVVVVVALEPPGVVVGVGVGAGVGVGVGAGVGVGVGVPVATPVHQPVCEPPFFDPVVLLLGFVAVVVVVRVGVGAGVGVRGEVGNAPLVEVVVVVEVVEVSDEPPLIEGFTLMTGRTSIIGELLIAAIAVAFTRKWP